MASSVRVEYVSVNGPVITPSSYPAVKVDASNTITTENSRLKFPEAINSTNPYFNTEPTHVRVTGVSGNTIVMAVPSGADLSATPEKNGLLVMANQSIVFAMDKTYKLAFLENPA